MSEKGARRLRILEHHLRETAADSAHARALVESTICKAEDSSKQVTALEAVGCIPDGAVLTVRLTAKRCRPFLRNQESDILTFVRDLWQKLVVCICIAQS